MNFTQRVVRRSALLSRTLLGLVVLSGLLLVHAVVVENISSPTLWLWQLKLLDLQSATDLLVATGAATLARAQYARTVRPAIGAIGRAVPDLAPDNRLAWSFQVTNAAQDVAVVTDVSYGLLLVPAEPDGPVDTLSWTGRAEVDHRLIERELVCNEDYWLSLMGVGRPLPAQGAAFVGWFTEEAMRVIVELYVRIQVVDRVGDVHERVFPCLRGADRTPRNPSPLLN
ncbi:hypothetical protein ACGFX4_18085 [Kitasatospora sp. NPDC048365]|uniref:hypothetical protein n=1 Tax=Kitasatospora sp. NPDC048365 TaxID=3364050 RepID=UPI003716F3A0